MPVRKLEKVERLHAKVMWLFKPKNTVNKKYFLVGAWGGGAIGYLE